MASPVEVRRSKRPAVCDRRRLYDGIREEEEEELGLEEVMLVLRWFRGRGGFRCAGDA